jgi:hypothetical protein
MYYHNYPGSLEQYMAMTLAERWMHNEELSDIITRQNTGGKSDTKGDEED